MKTILRPLLAVLVLLNFTASAQEASLKETGDIGRVTDVQGVASVRAKGGNRWSLATVGFPLKPGDWVRTDVRGANALRLRLSGGGELVLGPGTLVEVSDGGSVAFTSGEIEATAGKAGDLVILPSEGKSYALRDGDRKVFRRPDGRGVEILEKDPNWLLGFKGAVTTESMGSLLATVEGRNTPLTLGYHKVTVDIRDQIARTVIEESFVNHTDGRLEGVFYFPLPQDASISGFGMWINGELVEADVVEKQRAREIYETILRERRDPGLLEWTGGNIFKARVFPILAHSEKRIKITYTQVLPLKKGAYRYRYALQSEMLRENPLRELSVKVRVSSALPITGISCGTHPARIEHTAHAAQAEFTAQEYTPDQDFEIDIAVDASASPVVVIPHRRGEDGYFLALVTPPGGEGRWESERGLIPDGDPIDLVIVADTSGSMDATARANQDALIGALLSSLGPNDRYELATCDNEVRWFKPGDGVEGEGEILAARDWVAARTSLGWTDLDQAFAAVCGRVKGKANAQVIYIGDGVLSTGDADPVAFANRLQRLCGDCGATFHAVAPSSRYEPGVLKAIAAIGGGSRRRIEGSETAATVAGALLAEIARPGLRDLKVEFTGVRVARVYPEALPNLPEGEQQIMIGRYLPEGKDQRGEIVVTGQRNGREERFTAPVTVADAESGNSFIPRLWARMYLDVLLEQGTAQTIQDEIVALSEEYKIMTPYTSFLVLESDEDRERFKVKRRFEMRDGERFFAEGRDAAQEALLAKQMRLAGTWRMNLRRGFLSEISMMGREDYGNELASRLGDRRSYSYGPGSGLGVDWSGVMDGGYGGGGSADGFSRPMSTSGRISGFKSDARFDALSLDSASEGWDDSGRDFESNAPWGDAETKEEESLGERMEKISDEEWSDLDDISLYGEQQPVLRGRLQSMAATNYRGNRGLSVKRQGSARQPMLVEKAKSLGNGREYAGYGYFNGDHWRNRVQDLLSLFPAPIERGEKPERAPEHPWSREARELADALLRGGKLAEREDGVRVLVKQTSFDTRRGVESGRAETLALVAGKGWLVRTSGDRVDTQVDWWREGGERGRMLMAVGLGRTRLGEKADRTSYPTFLADSSLVSLAESAGHLTATVKELGDGRSELILEDAEKRYRGVYVIDTERNVLVSVTSFYDGKKTGSTAFSDFVEVAGCWWAKRTEIHGADGKVTSTTEVEVEALGEDAFTADLKEQLVPRQRTIEISNELPTVAAAKTVPFEGKPGFEFSFALFNHFVESQQWERADAPFEEMRAFAEGKPGFEILETRYLIMKRRNEEARARIFAAVKALAEGRDSHAFFLANRLRGEANAVASAAENHDLLELLKPIHARVPERLEAMREWKQAMVSVLQGINRYPEAVALQHQIAEEFPWDAIAQTQYANLLANAGDYHAALDWLDKVMGEDERAWTPGEMSGFRMTGLNFLENQSWIEEVARRTEEWLKAADVDEAGSFYYLRYLSALIRLDKVEEAYALIDAWLAAGVAAKGKDFDARTRNRLSAVIEIHLGRGYGVNLNEIPERFHAGLSEVVRAFALDSKDASFAEMLMNDYRFSRTEAARALRKHFTTVLEKRAARMPLANVNRLIGWISANDPAIDKAVWESILADLLKRWEAAKEPADRDAFASTVEGLLSRSLGQDRYLDFLRRKMREAEEARRGEFASQLFEALISGLWTPEIETEAFDLLYVIETPSDKDADLRAQRRVGALVRLDDWALRTRVAAAWEKVEQPEDLSRTARAEKEAEILREAREALASRLGEEMANREGETAEAMMDWLNAERLYLGVLLKRDPKEIAAECWEYLGKHDLFDKRALEALSWSESALVERHLAVLENLAARPKADEALVARLLEWLERGITAYPEDAVWKGHLQRMLVVLDRPDALKAALAAWTEEPSPERNEFRIALGYLHAELNEIAEAAQVFEAVKKLDELGPNDYRALADWYLLLQRADDRERATLARYEAMEEWNLSNLIQQHSSRIENGFNNGVPEDFDPEVVSMFKAIFRKSPNPGNHLYLLGSLYRYTKDFRLLQCVPEGVIGNSAGQIYPFLQSMNQVLQYVQDEAVCDEILAHLEIVRARVKTRVDARGLDLLEMLVRRKAAEVINQPGQQLPRALEAMRRAFKGDEWGTGERRLMAGFLASLGTIALEPLAAEQRAELEALYGDSEVGTPDRLHIGASYAGCLRGYGELEKAVDILGAAIAEYRASAAGGIFTQEEQSPFDQWIGYFESDRHFAEGEKQLAEAMDARLPEMLRQWLVERKYRLFSDAVSAGGRVSLGDGRELFDNVRKALAGELVTPHHSHRYQLCNLLIGLYRTAHYNAKIAGVPEVLVEFAGDPFDELVSFRTTNYQSLVQQLGSNLHEIAGDRAALAFLIARYESEPEFFRATGQGGWSRYGYQMAEYRSRVTDLGDLEARLLKIARAELRRDLETANYQNRALYHDDYNYFWEEKRADFLAVAESVLAERAKLLSTVRFVSDYLFHGLEARERAVEVLVSAHGRKLLDEGGVSQLADFLERMQRDKEAVPYLVELVGMAPGNMDHRRRLIGSLGRSGQRDQAVAAVDAAMAWAKEHHAWNEASLAPLAQGCHEGQYWDRGVILYDELVSLHQQTQPNRGIGNGTLSDYYTRLADCHVGLGQTVEAVEAAAGAIVSWGARDDQRAGALAMLRKVLALSKDLDAYVAHLDEVVAESGLENPTVRKALGGVYSERKEFDKAVAQLRLAAESQPEDTETQQLLVAAYDALGDAAAAIGQLIEAIHRSPRSIALLKDLGDRFENLQQPLEAERARTGIVEALPNESEGHAMLAEIRQAQERWAEAAGHWEQVAVIRKLEPTGLLHLARAEAKANARDKAKASAEKVLAREWPSRFGDVHAEARRILAELDKG